MKNFIKWIKTRNFLNLTFSHGLIFGWSLAILVVTLYQSYLYFDYFDLAKLNEISTLIKKVYIEDYDKEELFNGMCRGMIDSLDGYSSYMSVADYSTFVSGDENNFCGIGVKWLKFDDKYTIIKVFEDGPAYKAGLRDGDILWVLNDKNASAMHKEEIKAELSGKVGTPVYLTIIRDDNEMDFIVYRDNVHIPFCYYDIRDNIGIITITSFEGTVAEEFHNCIQVMNENNITNIIIDVRNNTGGVVELLGNIMQDIIPEDNIIFSLKRKKGDLVNYSITSTTDINYNFVVLVNKATASCSEILSGSLRDLCNAKLVGETTYGKGVIQDGMYLSNGASLLLTSGRYYLPNGEQISDTGLEPDYVVENDKDTFEDEQLNFALSLFN